MEPAAIVGQFRMDEEGLRLVPLLSARQPSPSISPLRAKRQCKVDFAESAPPCSFTSLSALINPFFSSPFPSREPSIVSKFP